MVEQYKGASIPKGFKTLDDEWYRMLEVIKQWATLEVTEKDLLAYLTNTQFTNPANQAVADSLIEHLNGN